MLFNHVLYSRVAMNNAYPAIAISSHLSPRELLTRFKLNQNPSSACSCYKIASYIFNDVLHTVTGGRLNKKDGLTRYGDSHVKDKTS